MSNLSPVLVGGEALYDFISTDVGSGLGGSVSFEKRAGGSPFNIAVGIRRLGVPVAYIGKFVSNQGYAIVDFPRRGQVVRFGDYVARFIGSGS